MIVTVFRSRVKPEIQKKSTCSGSAACRALANKMPGFISHKAFVAEDGERVPIVECESGETQRAWRLHPEHVEAQKEGAEGFLPRVPCAGLRGVA